MTQSTTPATRSARRQTAKLSRIDRLRPTLPKDGWIGWAVAVGITLFAFLLRLINLGYPNKVMFDETYYAKEAWSILNFGHETEWNDNANDLITQGDLSALTDSASNAVHPPLGKILIGIGEAAFGMDSFGWRIMAAVFGALLILVVIRMTRRLSGSTLVGAIAGVLLCFDGLHFVMSRIALLDIFAAFFSIAAVAALLVDRDWFRNRLADHLAANRLSSLNGSFGPVVWFRPWRLVAGVMFGLACGCKWSSLYVLATFSVLSVIWDVGARRLAGARKMSLKALIIDGPIAFVHHVIIAVLVYIATWFRWLGSLGGYFRDWGENNPDATTTQILGKPLASLWAYHVNSYEFHTGDYMRDQAEHTYQSHPSGWLVIGRPLGVDAVNGIQPGEDGCVGPEECMRVISAIGTPILWWVGVVALVIAVLWWVGNQDWRFGVPVIGVACTWLPWFPQAERPIFFFYAIMIIPFTVMAIALVLGKLIGERRTWRPGVIIAGAFIALVILNFGFFYPILTDGLLTRSQWEARMWFESWI